MKIPIYHVDAFTKKRFGGNPAAVCPLNEWLNDQLMQDIAMENNLSETAFLVKHGVEYYIRWFTPTVEVELCGHATLASAHIIFNHLSFPGDEVTFHSKSGVLKVYKEKNDQLTLNFPKYMPNPVKNPPACIKEGLKFEHAEIFKGPFDYMVVLESQRAVEELAPDFKALAKAESRGIVVTAPGDESDFVSRCFFPQSGIDEDPVTGSAHTMMTPYWAEVLGKTKLTAYQLSRRKGYMECELVKDRVYMSGHAITFMKGEIEL
jgi:PhzF family phenazine biosynthesis protein